MLGVFLATSHVKNTVYYLEKNGKAELLNKTIILSLRKSLDTSTSMVSNYDTASKNICLASC